MSCPSSAHLCIILFFLYYNFVGRFISNAKIITLNDKYTQMQKKLFSLQYTHYWWRHNCSKNWIIITKCRDFRLFCQTALITRKTKPEIPFNYPTIQYFAIQISFSVLIRKLLKNLYKIIVPKLHIAKFTNVLTFERNEPQMTVMNVQVAKLCIRIFRNSVLQLSIK